MASEATPNAATRQTDGAGPALKIRPQRVVGMGSSAGGIAALQALLHAVPTGAPNSYVVAQHMAPDQSSHLVELLSRQTELPVLTATDGTEIVARAVYVAPANCDIQVVSGRIALDLPTGSRGPSPSIDALFRSLAAAFGPAAVGVVLSGTGSDGAAGIAAIRAAGGLGIAQDPSTADFSAMPQAAIDCGVELVSDPAGIGAGLGRLAPVREPAAQAVTEAAKGPEHAVGTDTEASRQVVRRDQAEVDTPSTHTDAETVEAIIVAVRQATGIGFSGYRRPTIERQIARRQSTVGRESLGAYHDLVVADQTEARALARAILVTVTSFFRDRPSRTALRKILGRRCEAGPDARLRIWVPGCATGEEAYTAGMVAAAALGNPSGLSARLKVFATDLNEVSLAVSSAGAYPRASVTAIPREYRERWLVPTERGYKISPRLRECVVHAKHNVIFDPPFPNLDLICLRNTMIYLQPRLRDRVLGLCHFALAPEGLLMLGDSEQLSQANELFVSRMRPTTSSNDVRARPPTCGWGPWVGGPRPLRQQQGWSRRRRTTPLTRPAIATRLRAGVRSPSTPSLPGWTTSARRRRVRQLRRRWRPISRLSTRSFESSTRKCRRHQRSCRLRTRN